MGEREWGAGRESYQYALHACVRTTQCALLTPEHGRKMAKAAKAAKAAEKKHNEICALQVFFKPFAMRLLFSHDSR